jgi:hypothetical protein
LIVFADYLKGQGVIDDDGIQSLRSEVKAGVDAEVDAAWSSPDPDPESTLMHVFAEAPQRAPDAGATSGLSGNEKKDALETAGGEATPAESPEADPGPEARAP